MSVVLHGDRHRAESFGVQAERYDRVRPAYPEALLEAVLGIDTTGLAVLDVGCGTGIAARLLAARGAEVLGVEPDERMAAVARARGTAVEVSAFETWQSRGRTFDRVTSAQAWHWVDPVLGAAKAAKLLRAGGRICIFWNEARPTKDLATALTAIYRKHAQAPMRTPCSLAILRG